LCKDSGNYLKTVKTKDVFFPFFSSYLFIFKLPLPIVLEGKICKLHFNITFITMHSGMEKTTSNKKFVESSQIVVKSQFVL